MLLLNLLQTQEKISSQFYVVIKGLYSLNAIYYIMCFEFEIPNKKKDKNLNMIDAEFEVEPELEKVQEPVTVSVN
jgi:hypothetical protein